MLTIENKFGKQCVMNGRLLRGILLEGETLDEFLIRTTKPKLKRPVGGQSKGLPKHEPKTKRNIPFSTEDKSLIGTVTII